jgi:hypothetical protein
MAKRKGAGSRRTANVGVSLRPELFTQLLFPGVGGALSGPLGSACRDGLVPFSMDLDPSQYDSADAFRRDYLLSTILSKFDDEKSSNAKKAVAFEKFASAELQCYETNERFRTFVGGSITTGVTIEAVLFTASRKIQTLLGPLDLDEIAEGFNFGPGASTRLPRSKADLWYKFQGNPETTPNNSAFANTLFEYFPLWKREVSLGDEGLHYILVEGNRIVTVPKNAKTDRVIAIEPDLNLFVQKGFGAVIRSRLRRVGVELNDQRINQILARVGSIDGSLATIDLSSASDTISRAVVQHLLPPDWLSALEQCRSPYGRLPSGESIYYQKFSSMGNGFTFELESLIFWALGSALLDLMKEKDRRISVYGDDIILPSYAVEPFIGVLTFCGFSVNEGKSFWNGPFRESCGKHFFRGVDVTPFYLRSKPKRLSDVFLLHNNVVRWTNRRGVYREKGIEAGLLRFCEALRSSVPKNWRKPRIPLGFGDGAFVGSFDECTPTPAPRGFLGWQVQVLVEPRVLSDRGGSGRLLKSLFALERRPDPIRWDVLESSDGHRKAIHDPRFLRGVSSSSRMGVAKRLLPRSIGPSALRQYAFYPTDVGYDVIDLAQLGLLAGSAPFPPSGGTGFERSGGFGGVKLPPIELLEFPEDFTRYWPKSPTGFEVPLTSRARVTKTLVPRWVELGPWF